MSTIQLFKILQSVVCKYSKMAVRLLVQNYLRVKVIYNLPASTLEAFLATHLSPGTASVFLSRGKASRTVIFNCIIIQHPRLPHITHTILRQIDNCIVFAPSLAYRHNVLGRADLEETATFPAKLIIFRSQRGSFEALSESLDAYLSICELFHSHIHLTLNCFEAHSRLQLAQHLKDTEGDQLEGVVEEGYFRILEERASRVSMEELSEVCRIERMEWGEMMVFQQGHEGVVVWVTENFLPKLGLTPPVSMPSSRARQYLLFEASELGFKIFKRRELLKQRMHEMRFTTLIFNCHQYSPALDKEISAAFDHYCRRFFSEVAINSELRLLQENVSHGERICQLLRIHPKQLLQKLLAFS